MNYKSFQDDDVWCSECEENHFGVTVTIQEPPGIAGFRCPVTDKMVEA